jgi:hypothetical protein
MKAEIFVRLWCHQHKTARPDGAQLIRVDNIPPGENITLKCAYCDGPVMIQYLDPSPASASGPLTAEELKVSTPSRP